MARGVFEQSTLFSSLGLHFSLCNYFLSRVQQNAFWCIYDSFLWIAQVENLVEVHLQQQRVVVYPGTEAQKTPLITAPGIENFKTF